MSVKGKVEAYCFERGIAVERLAEGPDNPSIELIAPDGKHFVESLRGYPGLHSLLCFGWSDAAQRMTMELEPCVEACQ